MKRPLAIPFMTFFAVCSPAEIMRDSVGSSVTLIQPGAPSGRGRIALTLPAFLAAVSIIRQPLVTALLAILLAEVWNWSASAISLGTAVAATGRIVLATGLAAATDAAVPTMIATPPATAVAPAAARTATSRPVRCSTPSTWTCSCASFSQVGHSPKGSVYETGFEPDLAQPHREPVHTRRG